MLGTVNILIHASTHRLLSCIGSTAGRIRIVKHVLNEMKVTGDLLGTNS